VVGWFATSSKNNSFNKFFKVNGALYGLFVFMVILLLLVCCCGIAAFATNCDFKTKWQMLAKSPFTIGITCTILFFIVAGAVLIGISKAQEKVLTYVCDQESKDGKIGAAINFFTNIYDKSDEFYCTSTCKCKAELTNFKGGNDTYYSTLTLDSSNGV